MMSGNIKVEEMALQYGMAALLEPPSSLLAGACEAGAEESQTMLWKEEDAHGHITMSQWSEARASMFLFSATL